MFLHRSNRSERLVDALANIVRVPLSDPLAPERIVVHSKGMERWLAMQLSQRLGIWANAEFPFPRRLIEELFDAVLGDPAGFAEVFDQGMLMWSIAALLPQRLSSPAFDPIARYLADDDGSLLLQLSQRIARVFDDYVVFRPELLRQWRHGSEQSWEAVLWRDLCERHGDGHQAARAQRFLNALANDDIPPHALPERLCLFGMSSLPPLYLSVLSALAIRVPTHLFVLSPSREYFADLHRRGAAGDASADDAHGHPLLAALGRLGREFQALLEERTDYIESDFELYVEPQTDTLLHTLQSDMLALRQRGTAGSKTPRALLAEHDRSIAIQICHSPMRELEVLHDQLCDLLQDASLEPHDIVVMAPDIEAYAPVIEAVFAPKAGRPELPYSVADRTTRATHKVVDALYALLDMLCGRLTANAVLDVLSLDCVRQRFGIESEELDRLRAWIEQSGIRWGADAAHRAEVGQPPLADNTWRSGLSRLLLGYAMPPHGQHMFAGVLPFEGAEGSAAELLGKLAEVSERTLTHRLALAGRRTIEAWRTALLALLDDFIDSSRETAFERQLIRDGLDRLVHDAERAGFAGALELPSLQLQLERALDARLPARGLLARGITFCQLVPMRGIPFQVVCVIGMNDDAFPGRTPRLGFDRMTDPATRRAGDRSRRDDDRYLFLEALLCARRQLLLSYVGRGVRDNRVLPPSVVIGELLDAIAQAFEPASADAESSASDANRRACIEQRLCVLHRLHAFSPRYFEQGGDPRLFSYAAHACQGAQALGKPRSDRLLLGSGLLGGAELTPLTVDELVDWVTLPVRTFLQQRLGLYLGLDLAPLPDREPLSLLQLDRWKLGTDLLELALRGANVNELLGVARGHGTLPLGSVGTLAHEELMLDVKAIANAASRYRGAERLPPLRVELELDGVRISGTLHGLWPAAHFQANFSKLGKRFELGHFVRHVVLQCCAMQQRAGQPPHRYPERSVIVARAADGEGASEVHFGRLEQPLEVLSSLLALARSAQRAALPFVHDVSRSYAEQLRPEAKASREQALRVAEKLFDDPHGYADAYAKLIYPDFAALNRDGGDAGFTRLAEAVFTPFFRARTLITPAAPDQAAG